MSTEQWDALQTLLTAPFVIFLIVLVIGGCIAAVLYEPEPLCQYCNNDGDPCPRCGGYKGGRR